MTRWFALVVLWLLVSAVVPVFGQPQDLTPRIGALEQQVKALQSQVDRLGHRASQGAVLFLYGVFCALWAQNTGRNATGWFFLGLFFNFITVLVLLYKNAEDRKRPTAATTASD